MVGIGLIVGFIGLIVGFIGLIVWYWIDCMVLD